MNMFINQIMLKYTCGRYYEQLLRKLTVSNVTTKTSISIKCINTINKWMIMITKWSDGNKNGHDNLFIVGSFLMQSHLFIQKER